jgi:hypothetical protein
MTCLELRRRLLIDPHRMDADIFNHVADCPACRTAADGAAAFEMRLQAAFDVAEQPHLTDPVISALGSGRRCHGGNASAGGAFGASAARA